MWSTVTCGERRERSLSTAVHTNDQIFYLSKKKNKFYLFSKFYHLLRTRKGRWSSNTLRALIVRSTLLLLANRKPVWFTRVPASVRSYNSRNRVRCFFFLSLIRRGSTRFSRFLRRGIQLVRRHRVLYFGVNVILPISHLAVDAGHHTYDACIRVVRDQFWLRTTSGRMNGPNIRMLGYTYTPPFTWKKHRWRKSVRNIGWSVYLYHLKLSPLLLRIQDKNVQGLDYPAWKSSNPNIWPFRPRARALVHSIIYKLYLYYINEYLSKCVTYRYFAI